VATKDIIVIGASLGGIETLKTLAGTLPPDLKACIFVVIHLSPTSPGILPSLLERAGPLSSSNAKDGEEIRHGHIFVAPPDHHMTVEPSGRVCVSRGPKENLWRPAVDPLFRSAAHAFGPRVIGVILTGNLDDGASGLWTVKQHGGTAVVQKPEEALASAMPLNAMLWVAVDHCVSLQELGPLLTELTNQTVKEKGGKPMSEQTEIEIKIAQGSSVSEELTVNLGAPSSFACPECHGVLSEIREGRHFRFRCHTGHAYSLQSLLDQLKKGSEEALWNAIRAIEEKILLLKKAAAEMPAESEIGASEFLQEVTELERQRDVLRRLALARR
jgi:two-component system chemotaxis response regulator CheB